MPKTRPAKPKSYCDPSTGGEGEEDPNIARVEAELVINGSVTIPGFVSVFTHKRDYPASFTLNASGRLYLKKGDTVQVRITPGGNGETYKVNSAQSLITIERVRQFE